MSRIRLTINSDLKDVVLIGIVVGRICEHIGMDQVEAAAVELSAVEAVTNSIRHAYCNDAGKEVSVTLSISEKRLAIEVADTGLPMPAAAQDCLTDGSPVFEFDPKDTSSLPEGGMGLQIMHEVMDELSYRREGETNTLQLVRLIRAVESGDAVTVTSPRTEMIGSWLGTSTV